MHPALIDAHVEMMRRITAEERLAAASVAALGAGTLQKEDAKSMRSELTKAARGRQRGKAATARDIAGMGIGVKIVGRD
jgi:hypothetical protein